MTMVDNLYGEHFLDMVYDEENAWLYANWKGYQTDKSVKEGINRMIRMLEEHQASRVLNDNSNTLGIWMGVATWLIYDALPRARKAGLKSFAHVYGPSRFSRISAEGALLLLSPAQVDIKAFEDIESAKSWLRRQPGTHA
jgi:hypothetical protein